MWIWKPDETPTTIDEIRGDSWNTFAQLTWMFEAIRTWKIDEDLSPASKNMIEDISKHTRKII